MLTLNTKNVDIKKTNQALTHAARVCSHGNSSNLWVLNYQQTYRAPTIIYSFAATRPTT